MVRLADDWAIFSAALSDRHIAKLETLGVPPFIARSHLGIALVEKFGAGFWQPMDDGLPAFIVPVGSWRHLPGTWHEIVDLVAWWPNQPDQWALRTGDGLLLGVEVAEETRWHCRPLDLDPTPLAWLQRGCSGATIVNWHRVHPVLDFAGQVEIRCATPELRRRLARRMAELAAPTFDLVEAG